MLLSKINCKLLFADFDTSQKIALQNKGLSLFWAYRLEVLKYYQILRKSRVVLGTKSNIHDLSENLDKLYIYERAKFYVYAFTLKSLFSIKVETKNLEAFLAFAQHERFQNDTEIRLYILLLKLYYSEKKDHVDIFVNELEQEKTTISKSLLKELYDLINNFCYKQLLKGNDTFLEYAFYVSKGMLENNLINFNSPNFKDLYFNYSTNAAKLKEFEWALNFSEQHKKYLNKETREVFYNYNLAAIEFYKENYSEALFHIEKVSKKETDVFHEINHDILVIKALFCLEDEERLEDLDNSIERFRKNCEYKGTQAKVKLSPERLERYDNFRKIITRLVTILKHKIINPNATYDHIKTLLENTQKSLDDTENIVYRNWLQQQINEFLWYFKLVRDKKIKRRF